MKTMLTYGLVLLVILAFGLGVIAYLQSSSDELSQQLAAIKGAVSDNDWQKAERLLEQTEADWEKTSKIWAALVNHQEIDQLEVAFAKLSEYLGSQERALALAELEATKLLVEHIPEKERVSLANLF